MSRYRTLIQRVLITLILAAGLWWVLSGGSADSWKFGIPAMLAAALVAVLQAPPRRAPLRLGGMPRFIVFFLIESARGGVDVARRALSPSLPIEPGFIEYHTRLPRGPSRAFFMAVINLVPGTLTVRATGDRITVHALDTRMPLMESLAALETRVMELFVMPASRGGRS